MCGAERVSVPQSPHNNAEANWQDFDPEAYFDHYYSEPHRDDMLAARKAALALRSFAGGCCNLHILDVGTGANLIPLLAALPVAQSLTAWDYAASNVAWLKTEFQQEKLRPQWQYFWSQVVEVYGPHLASFDAAQKLKQCARAQQGSIFDLPPAQWDAASMFFCAESITREAMEFTAACKAFAAAVRPGGALVAAFLTRSAGYEVGGIAYPALPVDEESIKAVFTPLCRSINVETIGGSDTEIRSGYSGMIFLSAFAL
jgi:SAM-dependent methyltransferase